MRRGKKMKSRPSSIHSHLHDPPPFHQLTHLPFFTIAKRAGNDSDFALKVLLAPTKLLFLA